MIKYDSVLRGYRTIEISKKSIFLLLLILKALCFVNICNNVSRGNSNNYGNYTAESSWVHHGVTASQNGIGVWDLTLKPFISKTTFSNTVYIVTLERKNIFT